MPEVVDEQTAALRARGPGQHAAATALAAALVDLAAQALHDRSAAEAIVTDIMQSEATLLATATRAVTPTQREEAEAALARLVRRAALDAMPPVVSTAKPVPAGRESGAASPGSRKLRPLNRKGAAREAPMAGGRRPRVAAMAGLLVLGLVLAGLAAWQLLPSDAQELAEQPAPAPTEMPQVSTRTQPEALQLEAVEPEGGPLREMAPQADAAPVAMADAGSQATDGAGTQAQQALPAETSSPPPPGALPIEGGNLRVYILYPEGEPAASEADSLYAALSRTGQVPLVVLRDVSFAVGAPRIRYYHSDDAAAAGALADFLEPPNGSWLVQDFGHIRPLPVPGTVEIYVPSVL